MASLFALGVMSIAWMAFVAGLIAVEKLVPWRRAATYGTAAILLVLGVLLLAAPGRDPGPDDPGRAARCRCRPSPPLQLECRRTAECEAAGLLARDEPEVRETVENAAQRRRELESRQVGAQAVVLAEREREVAPRILAVDVVPERVGEDGSVAVGGETDAPTNSPASSRPRRSRCGASSSAR